MYFKIKMTVKYRQSHKLVSQKSLKMYLDISIGYE